MNLKDIEQLEAKIIYQELTGETKWLYHNLSPEQLKELIQLAKVATRKSVKIEVCKEG